MKEVDFRPEKKTFKEFASAFGLRPEDFVRAINQGRNGVSDLFEKIIEVAVLEYEDRDQMGLQKFFKNAIQINIKRNLAESYNKATAFKPGMWFVYTQIFHIMACYLEDCNMSQEHAEKRLNERLTELKNNNTPKLKLEGI